jgi:RHS repeat-associated protein
MSGFAQSAQIAATPVSNLRVNLTWSSSTSIVRISYRLVNATGWTSVYPDGALPGSSQVGGIKSPGSGTIALPAPGSYVFQVMGCAMLPTQPAAGNEFLGCGPNVSHYGGTFNGAVAQSPTVTLTDSPATEFDTTVPGFIAPLAGQIKVTPLNHFGKIQVDWKGTGLVNGFAGIQYKTSDATTWTSVSPGSAGFPSVQAYIPFSTSTHTGITQDGSATTYQVQSGTYIYRMRTCKYSSQTQGVPGTLECGEYSESAPAAVEALNLSNLSPLVSFNAPAANVALTVGQSTSLRVVATDPAIAGITNTSSQISKVEFYITTTPGQLIEPTKKVATVTTASGGYYQHSFTPSAAGDYYLVAVATDTGGATGHAVMSVRAVAPVSNPPAPNNTTPINFSRYAIYYGDFNGDGVTEGDGKRDIYFHGLPLVIILHGDIATPIVLPAPPGFAFFGKGDGSYEPASEWDMTDEWLASCQTCARAISEEDFVLGDMNNDGNPDILVLGENGSVSSLLISGTEGTALPQVLLEILSTGQTRKPGQAASQTPYFTDNLSGSAPKIVNGQIQVNGMAMNLASLQQVASTQGASLATNQSIVDPPAPNLPSPTLNAADLAEMDSLASLGGEFRVNEAGAATYTVPLALPAGTAGVAPELALSYSSQAGVGNMGLGWSLSAGGSISRCRQTLQVDGETQPIQFSASDRFCLDGQRLLLVTGSTYGAIGATYKPEIDNGVIVASVGGTSGHPETFNVTAKDGSTSIFGISANNAKQSGYASITATTPQSSRVMSWHLAEFKDSVGNKIVFDYTFALDYYRLAKISYAYGDTSSAPDVVVEFAYGPRKKTDVYWVAGSRFADNSRLNTVTVKDKNEIVREYRVVYNNGIYQTGNDIFDRVVNIKSCLGEQCSRPLQLDWGFAAPGAANGGNGKVKTYTGNIFETSVSNADKSGYPTERIHSGVSNNNVWQVNGLNLSDNANGAWYYTHQDADINGDGRQDLLTLEAYTAGTPHTFRLYSLLQTATGFATRKLFASFEGSGDAPGGRHTPQLQPVDFNADGRMDLAVYWPFEKKWKTYFSLPKSAGDWELTPVLDFLPAAVNNPAIPVDNIRFLDMNADGLPDAVYTKNGVLNVEYLRRDPAEADTSEKAYTFLLLPSSDASPDLSMSTPDLDLYNMGGVADLNEDGRVDILGTKVSLTPTSVTTNTPQGSYTVTTCAYTVDFQSLITTGTNSFTVIPTTAVAQGSFTANWGGAEKIIAHCDLHDFRRRIFGPFLTDIDSDGLVDLVWGFGNPRYVTWNDIKRDPEYVATVLYYKKGKSDRTFDVQKSVSLNFEAKGLELMDTDMDGDQDLVVSTAGDRKIVTWNGSDFSSGSTVLAGSGSARYSDLNGDGFLDKSIVTNGKLTVTRGAPVSNNIVIRFVTGLGAATSVFYEPLRDSGRYSKMGGIGSVQTGYAMNCIPLAVEQGGGCYTNYSMPIFKAAPGEFYRQINDPFGDADPNTSLGIHSKAPAMEIISTAPVVTRVASSAPTGGTLNTLAGVDYSYEGQKLQAGGRGFLGFKKLTTTDMQTGILTQTEYRQDWPFVGSPVKTTTKTRYGNVLKESTSKMAIVGIDGTNITTKRGDAQTGTKKLGPLVLYTKEARDITYDVPEAKLAMPAGPVTPDSTVIDKLSEVITTTIVNAFGNVDSMEVQTLNGTGNLLQKQKTVNEYFSEGDGQRHGRLKKATVTTERPGLTQVRVADFTYDGYSGSCIDPTKTTGLMCSEKISVSVSDLGQGNEAPEMTEYNYDIFGNKTFSKTGTRVSLLAEYDGKGRFVQATYDVFRSETGLGTSAPTGYTPAGAVAVKTSEVLTRDKFGNALLSRNAIGNGNWVYAVQATTPQGTIYFRGDSTGAFEETRMQRVLITTANWCPPAAVYVSAVTKAGGARATQCFDKVGRDIGGYVIDFAGNPIRTRKDYDVLGRVVKVFEPAQAAAPSLFTTTTYDVLGRPVLVTYPFNTTSAIGTESAVQATTSFNYAGYITTTTVAGHTDGNIGNRVKQEDRNALGELVKITEMGNRSIEYKYNVMGKLTETKDPAGNKVTIIYNGLGQKTSMSDPDKGNWTYYYNSYGELKSQTDANLTTTTNIYDFKGRQITQIVDPTEDTLGHKISWEYDLAENGLGNVGREVKSSLAGVMEFTRQAGFDRFGRANLTTTTFKGTGTADESHYQKVVYDNYGRVYQTFDAARAGPQFTYNGVQNDYNSYGYLAKVQDAASGGTAPFYTVTNMNARGNVTRMVYGSGEEVTYLYNTKTGFLEQIKRALGTDIKAYDAKWDHLGNLVSRDPDLLGGKAETFSYDKFNRLETNTLVGETPVTVVYDSIDNITKKSDVENNSTYQYIDSESPNRKHAVTEVGSRKFRYDKNGNMIEEKANSVVKKKLTYTGNDLVKKIEVVGAHTSEFFYDSGNSRYKRIDRDSTGKVTTTLYLGSVEKIHNHDSTVQWKRQIGAVAQVTHAVTASSIATGVRRYFHADHLGSINAISSSTGVIEHRMAFDPWGARRTVNSSGVWQPGGMAPASILASYAKTAKPTTNRGFTGHEMLDEVGIIHMNGRIYDAYLGRFLQADPIIQEPTMVGSLNRYSYTMNNPLNAVDPSGFSWLSKQWKKWIKPLVVVVAVVALSVVTAGAAGAWALGMMTANGCLMATTGMLVAAGAVGGAAAGFVAGVSMAAFNGANLRDSVKAGAKGALSGAVFGGVAGAFGQTWSLSRVGANGLAGGATSKINGGNFNEGFKEALAVSLLTYGNYKMRQSRIKQLLASGSERNLNGESTGFFGDNTKLAGAGEVINPETGLRQPCVSLMGGCQGMPVNNKVDTRSSFFGKPYDPGALRDSINESFAGPHDWLRNATGSYITKPQGPYDILGNGKYLTGFDAAIDSVKNYALVLPAAPFAIAGLIDHAKIYDSLREYRN